MAIKHSSVAVGTTATALTSSVTDTDGRTVGRSVLISNPAGGASVFVGGPGVTTSSYGHELVAGSVLALDLGSNDIPYAVVASGTVTVRVLHLGV